MKYLALVSLLLLLGCKTIGMAMDPEVPVIEAALHLKAHAAEKQLIARLDATVKDASIITDADLNDTLLTTQAIKRDLMSFSDWLRNSGIDGKVLEATTTRLQVWEDMEMFFVAQEDAYFKDRMPLDQETRAEVLDYLGWLRRIGKITADWIEEKGVIDG